MSPSEVPLQRKWVTDRKGNIYLHRVYARLDEYLDIFRELPGLRRLNYPSRVAGMQLFRSKTGRPSKQQQVWKDCNPQLLQFYRVLVLL